MITFISIPRCSWNKRISYTIIVLITHIATLVILVVIMTRILSSYIAIVSLCVIATSRAPRFLYKRISRRLFEGPRRLLHVVRRRRRRWGRVEEARQKLIVHCGRRGRSRRLVQQFVEKVPVGGGSGQRQQPNQDSNLHLILTNQNYNGPSRCA